MAFSGRSVCKIALRCICGHSADIHSGHYCLLIEWMCVELNFFIKFTPSPAFIYPVAFITLFSPFFDSFIPTSLRLFFPPTRFLLPYLKSQWKFTDPPNSFTGFSIRTGKIWKFANVCPIIHKRRAYDTKHALWLWPPLISFCLIFCWAQSTKTLYCIISNTFRSHKFAEKKRPFICKGGYNSLNNNFKSAREKIRVACRLQANFGRVQKKSTLTEFKIYSTMKIIGISYLACSKFTMPVFIEKKRTNNGKKHRCESILRLSTEKLQNN